VNNARLRGSLGAARRALAGRPQTYPQAWLVATVSAALPLLVVFSIFGICHGWHQPWPAFALECPPVALLFAGLALSHDVRQRRKARLPSGPA
jgi:hypothetical protein